MPKPFLTTILLASLIAPPLLGANIEFVGTLIDDANSEITEWKTSSTPKSFDPDGDGIYGTLAHQFFGIEFAGEGIFYQNSGSNSVVGPFGGYTTVDHPNGTSPDIRVRTTTNSGGGQQNHTMFSFTALAGSPANVRIGIATDGLNGSQFSPATIGLRQTNGAMASVEHTLTAVNTTIDMVFFDLTGIAAGDQFEVFADSGPVGYATHHFVTWDEGNVVTTNADAGPGSLRQVLADTSAGGIISFDPGLSGQTITLAGNQISIDKDITIDASTLPAGITLSGDYASRVFEISSNLDVTLESLTIAHGNNNNQRGGGIHITSSSTTVTLRDCTLHSNSSTEGGAIYSFADPLILENCTLTNNSGTFGSSLQNRRSTILRHTTIVGNTSSQAGGIWMNGPLTLHNSIVAGNTGQSGFADIRSVSGLITWEGENIVQKTDNGTGSPINADPLLSPLSDNGGPTLTMLPLTGSPAIDAGTQLGNTPATDQRGLPRSTGFPDIGAVELVRLLAMSTHTIDAGGGQSTGSSFTLTGSIGQPDASQIPTTPFQFNAGFWTGFGTELEGYSEWAATNFAFGLDRSFNGDANDDGFANGLVYALGPDGVETFGPGLLTAPPSFIPEDVRLSLQYGPDLVQWWDALEYVGGVQTFLHPDFSIIDDLVDHNTTDPRIFYRYDVELQP